MSITENLLEILHFLPDGLTVMLFAAFPIAELRGAIPVGILFLDMHWYRAATYASLGNMLVVPTAFWLLPRVEALSRRSPATASRLDRLFARARRRSGKPVERWEELGIFLLVALPLPGTGAWTGAIMAYLFGLPRYTSGVAILTGVLVSTIWVTAATVSGQSVFGTVHDLFT